MDNYTSLDSAGGNTTLFGTTNIFVPGWAVEVRVAYLALIAVLGSTGNLVIILVQVRNRRKSSTDWLVGCTALFDLAMSMICTCTTIMVSVPTLWETIGSDGLCKFHRYFLNVTSFSSVGILTAIVVDRYLKTCYAHKNIFTTKRAKNACICVSMSGFILNIPAMFTHGQLPNGTCRISDRTVGYVYYALHTVLFISAFLVLGVCYYNIGRILRNRVRKVGVTSEIDEGQPKRQERGNGHTTDSQYGQQNHGHNTNNGHTDNYSHAQTVAVDVETPISYQQTQTRVNNDRDTSVEESVALQCYAPIIVDRRENTTPGNNEAVNGIEVCAEGICMTALRSNRNNEQPTVEMIHVHAWESPIGTCRSKTRPVTMVTDTTDNGTKCTIGTMVTSVNNERATVERIQVCEVESDTRQSPHATFSIRPENDTRPRSLPNDTIPRSLPNDTIPRSLPNDTIPRSLPSYKKSSACSIRAQKVNRTTRIMFMITITCIVTWVLLFTLSSLESVLKTTIAGKVVLEWGASLFMLNCVANPIVYIALSSRFRGRVWELAPCLHRRT